jgi:hypothetical protein
MVPSRPDGYPFLPCRSVESRDLTRGRAGDQDTDAMLGTSGYRKSRVLALLLLASVVFSAILPAAPPAIGLVEQLVGGDALLKGVDSDSLDSDSLEPHALGLLPLGLRVPLRISSLLKAAHPPRIDLVSSGPRSPPSA